MMVVVVVVVFRGFPFSILCVFRVLRRASVLYATGSEQFIRRASQVLVNHICNVLEAAIPTGTAEPPIWFKPVA